MRKYDTLLTPLFSPDGQHVAYQAKSGDKWYIVVDNTPNAGTTASYTTPEFNSDSTLIAYVEAAPSNADMRLIVSDLTFRKQNVKRSIGDLLFTTNRNRTRIAAAQVAGNKLRIVDFSFAEPDVVHKGPLYVVLPVFSPDGKRLMYRARKGGERFIVVADTAGRTIRQHPAYEQVFQPGFTADGKSVVYGVKDGNKLVSKVESM